MKLADGGSGVVVKAVLNVLVASTFNEVVIFTRPAELSIVSVPPLVTLTVESCNPVVPVEVAKIIEPLLILIGPIVEGPTEYSLVVD